MANFPYYNTVDQILHADWVAGRFATRSILRETIAKLWPEGHPTKLIQVGGTSGKGSTCRFLEQGLSTMGKSGAFFSPHLFDYRERFSISGEFAAQDDITMLWEERILPLCVEVARREPQHALSYFQVTLLMALALFDYHDVEWAALEVYVGGRYDYTSALDVAATVLTNVGSDHARLIGSEQWQRALDKSGIARAGIPFFTSDIDPQNLEVIRAICESVGAPLHRVDEEVVEAVDARIKRRYQDELSTDSLLHARYQRWNAALALTTLEHLLPNADEDALIQSFADARLVGRFWQVDDAVYADIAHNAEKIGALTGELKQRFAGQEMILVIGMSQQRVPSTVFAELATVAKAIIVTGGANAKLQDADSVYQSILALTTSAQILVVAEPRQAYAVARAMREDGDVVLLTGSTYMIEQVLNPDDYLRHLNASYGWRYTTDTQAKGTVELTLPKPPPKR